MCGNDNWSHKPQHNINSLLLAINVRQFELRKCCAIIYEARSVIECKIEKKWQKVGWSSDKEKFAISNALDALIIRRSAWKACEIHKLFIFIFALIATDCCHTKINGFQLIICWILFLISCHDYINILCRADAENFLRFCAWSLKYLSSPPSCCFPNQRECT